MTDPSFPVYVTELEASQAAEIAQLRAEIMGGISFPIHEALMAEKDAEIERLQAALNNEEAAARAIAEWHAPNSWDIIGDDLKNAHRRLANAVLKALAEEGK